MEEKNIALLGFVSSAADYLREQIKDDGDEIKTLEDVDLNKIKSELENKLGSSFDGAKNKSDDLINAGREVFDNFISKSPTLIDEFKDIFDVDFKKENDEKDEKIVSHLINILKRPQENDENDDLVNQIAKAASETSLENKPKVAINNTNEDKELDSIFSEILANENTEELLGSNPIEEEPIVEEDNTLEDSKSEASEASLDPNEIKQLIKDTISEFFSDKKQESVIKLDEVIDSYDVLKNVTESQANKEDFNLAEQLNPMEENVELEEVQYDELNTNNYSLIDGVFKRVDIDQEIEEVEEKENATIEDVFVDDESSDFELEEDDLKLAASKLEDEVNSEQTSDSFIAVDDVLDSKNISDDDVEIDEAFKEAEHNYLVDDKTSYEEVSKEESKNNNVEEDILLNGFNVEEAIEKELLEIQNKKADIEETKKTNNDDYSFIDGILVSEADPIEESIVIEENLKSDDKEKDSFDSENIEEFAHVDSDIAEALSNDITEKDSDSIPLFDDVPLSKKLTSFTDQYESSDNPYSKNVDLTVDKDDYDFEIGRDDSNDSISSFLKELKENKQQDYSKQTNDIIADLIDESRALSSDEAVAKEENEPIIIENDYVKAYNDRSLEEMYIPNPGLNALEEKDTDIDESTLAENKEENQSNEDTYLNGLFDEFINNSFEVDEIGDKHKQEEAKKKEIFDSIVALYPYLSNGFIKGVYDLKQSFVNDYQVGEKIVILHRLHFDDINGLRQFVDVMINHGYLVNVDEKQMIVDAFKEHINSDGKILTDIFEVANQGKLLTGDYEGYRIIEDEL